MDDERHLAGMTDLHRQTRPASTLPPSLASLPPRSVPESRPTRLQAQYINLSVVGLVLGAIAISALELGASLASPVVRLSVLIGAPLLILTTFDATIRIWRSAWAWMPVDRGKGLFRLSWLVASILLMAVLGTAWIAVLRA